MFCNFVNRFTPSGFATPRVAATAQGIRPVSFSASVQLTLKSSDWWLDCSAEVQRKTQKKSRYCRVSNYLIVKLLNPNCRLTVPVIQASKDFGNRGDCVWKTKMRW